MKIIELLLFATAMGQGYRQHGICVSLPHDDIQIMKSQPLRRHGMMRLKIKNLEPQLFRRVQRRAAGVINDNSFFEIQMTASSPTHGNLQLFPSRTIRPPVSYVTNLRNNQFRIDIDDHKSASLSNQGFVTLKLFWDHSADGKQAYNQVTYNVQSVMLCDGGYSDSLNQAQLGIPSGCVAAASNVMASRAHGHTGMGTFTTRISSVGDQTIGCGAYVLLSFDAAVKFTNPIWPIRETTEVNKQLDICTKSGSNGCNGFFHKIEFVDNDGFTNSNSAQLQLEMEYEGSAAHVPIGMKLYNCDFGRPCVDGVGQPGQSNNNQNNQNLQINNQQGQAQQAQQGHQGHNQGSQDHNQG